jgi:quercetin dioxygenase-like cupin family protein
MYIQRASEGDTVERSDAPIFEGGQVWGHALTGSASDMITASIVNFAAGARTKMHRHTSDQILHVVAGIGQVGDGGGDHTIALGDTVVIPAGADHWHGAGDTGSPMSHLTIMRADSETTVLDG